MDSFFKTPAGFVWVVQFGSVVATALGFIGATALGYDKHIVVFVCAFLALLYASVVCGSIFNQGTLQLISLFFTFGVSCGVGIVLHFFMPPSSVAAWLCFGAGVLVFFGGLIIGQFEMQAFWKAIALLPTAALFAAVETSWGWNAGVILAIALLVAQCTIAILFGLLYTWEQGRHTRGGAKPRVYRT